MLKEIFLGTAKFNRTQKN